MKLEPPINRTASKVTTFFALNIKSNPFEANLKCSGSTIHKGFGTPHTENSSKYSSSTFHTCMKLEPPIPRSASKVYPLNVFALKLLFIPC